MAFTSSRRKQGRKILYIYKKMVFNHVNLHINSRESNNLNTLNSDNVIGNSNLPRINVQTKSSFITPVTFQK